MTRLRRNRRRMLARLIIMRFNRHEYHYYEARSLLLDLGFERRDIPNMIWR